jgi:hypothetical protein
MKKKRKNGIENEFFKKHSSQSLSFLNSFKILKNFLKDEECWLWFYIIILN